MGLLVLVLVRSCSRFRCNRNYYGHKKYRPSWTPTGISFELSSSCSTSNKKIKAQQIYASSTSQEPIVTPFPRVLLFLSSLSAEVLKLGLSAGRPAAQAKLSNSGALRQSDVLAPLCSLSRASPVGTASERTIDDEAPTGNHIIAH